MGDEWASVKGLVQALGREPQLLEQDSEGNAKWRTSVGDLWVPPGANVHYVARTTAEIAANVYATKSGRSLHSAYVVDCGANIGVFSRYALDRGAAHVVAFEPSPATAQCLRRNLAPELASGRATVIEKGVWNRETTLGFASANKGNPGSHHVVEDADGADVEIPVTTIDLAIDSLGWSRVDYIKMDIEGAEVEALEGGSATIRRHRPICAIATEHTSDILANNLAVVDAIKKTDSRYDYVCTEVHVYDSPSAGRVLTPYTLLFQMQS